MDKTLLTKNDSQAIKGMAICLMLAHHLFMHESFFQGMEVDFFLFSTGRVETLAQYARICVPMFVFVTAYGFALKTDRKPELSMRETGSLVGIRLVKLMIPFWFVFLIFQIICNLSGIRSYGEIYGHGYRGLFYFILDGLGLASCSGTHVLNETWWYMSLAILLICIMPIICAIVRKFGFATVPGALILFRCSGWDNTGYFNYILVAFLGAAIYYCDMCGAVERFAGKNAGKNILVFLAILILIFGGYVIKLIGNFTDYEYLIVIPAIVILQQRFISRMTLATKILAFLGKYSMMMFLTHSFIKAYFFHDFFYSFKYGILIWIVLMICSLLLAMALEGAMKLLRINRLINILESKLSITGQ